MADDSTAAMLAALQAQLAALQAPAAAAPATAWGMVAPPPPAVGIVGVSIPIKYQTPLGSVKVLLTLPAECGSSPAALDAAIQGLLGLGFQVDAWQPKDQGGSGWGGNRGGNTGGWRR